MQAGAGRTGKMWCIEHYEVEPDMITWEKGMGGDVPMTSVACMTNIDIITENDSALIKRAAELGTEIKNMIKDGAKETH